ncbi:fucolectin-6-like, partial [Patella vulgata]|uniref:fucolectin-6-like n=1 Tax=Patella vulgata TaxID=6465 RepID=UPI0021808119
SGDFNPWWQVDLEWMYDITSITISNRYDDKLRVFGCTVRTFECDEKTVGRFIRISKPTEYLTMCEVEVTGISQ